MIRHIVLWSHKDGLSAEEKKENAKKIKSEIEGLAQKIKEIVEIKIYADLLPTSGRDIVLNSLFKSAEDLAAYQIHPEHVRAAGFVSAVVQDKVVIDYEE